MTNAEIICLAKPIAKKHYATALMLGWDGKFYGINITAADKEEYEFLLENRVSALWQDLIYPLISMSTSVYSERNFEDYHSWLFEIEERTLQVTLDYEDSDNPD